MAVTASSKDEFSVVRQARLPQLTPRKWRG